MNEPSEARNFEKIISYRDIFKRLNQITWAVREAEQRFPLGSPISESSLLVQYAFLYKKFIDLSKEAEVEAR